MLGPQTEFIQNKYITDATQEGIATNQNLFASLGIIIPLINNFNASAIY